MVQNQTANLSVLSPSSPSPQPLFQFRVNEVVLARHQGELYYAKIVSVHLNKKIARVLFDDGSKDDIAFDHIHSGKCLIVFNVLTVCSSRGFGQNLSIFGGSRSAKTHSI